MQEISAFMIIWQHHVAGVGPGALILSSFTNAVVFGLGAQQGATAPLTLRCCTASPDAVNQCRSLSSSASSVARRSSWRHPGGGSSSKGFNSSACAASGRCAALCCYAWRPLSGYQGHKCHNRRCWTTTAQGGRSTTAALQPARGNDAVCGQAHTGLSLLPAAHL